MAGISDELWRRRRNFRVLRRRLPAFADCCRSFAAAVGQRVERSIGLAGARSGPASRAADAADSDPRSARPIRGAESALSRIRGAGVAFAVSAGCGALQLAGANSARCRWRGAVRCRRVALVDSSLRLILYSAFRSRCSLFLSDRSSPRCPSLSFRRGDAAPGPVFVIVRNHGRRILLVFLRIFAPRGKPRAFRDPVMIQLSGLRDREMPCDTPAAKAFVDNSEVESHGNGRALYEPGVIKFAVHHDGNGNDARFLPLGESCTSPNGARPLVGGRLTSVLRRHVLGRQPRRRQATRVARVAPR